jgi:hypothetical protein
MHLSSEINRLHIADLHERAARERRARSASLRRGRPAQRAERRPGGGLRPETWLTVRRGAAAS